MPRILHGRYAEQDAYGLTVGSFATTRHGVYWQLHSREPRPADSTVLLTLMPVDGHDVPDGATVFDLPRHPLATR